MDFLSRIREGLSERQRKKHRLFAWLGAVAFTVLSAIFGYRLFLLYFGLSKQELIWEPISYIYHELGFWPAVLVPPLTGVVVTYVNYRLGRSEPPTQKTTSSETDMSS